VNSADGGSALPVVAASRRRPRGRPAPHGGRDRAATSAKGKTADAPGPGVAAIFAWLLETPSLAATSWELLTEARCGGAAISRLGCLSLPLTCTAGGQVDAGGHTPVLALLHSYQANLAAMCLSRAKDNAARPVRAFGLFSFFFFFLTPRHGVVVM